MGLADLLILIGGSLMVTIAMFIAGRWADKKGPILYTTVDELDNSLTFEVSQDISDAEYQRRLTEMTDRLARMRKKESSDIEAIPK